MPRFARLAVFALTMVPAFAQAPSTPLDDVTFTRLQQELTPDPAAPWRTIPWQLDLLAAQRDAAAQRKPLFIWAMDGHPLGCT